ncbi:MAG: cytochrome b/b6 domain-containing protein [Gammaproteobacteria bacterium]|nr:cytochrome b/b6 domain-containing protein [Gammaproteobacteria bacterium]
MNNNSISRYHPMLVVLHWLVAVVVILGLIVGPIMAAMPLEQKVLPLQGHMAANLAIGLLVLVRLVVRFTTRRPPPATTGNRWLDWLRKLTHVLLYVVVLCMVSTGLGMAFLGDLFEVVYRTGVFPEAFRFDSLPPNAGHRFFANVLIVLIALHVAGALYHQFVLKDRLLSRMWFGRRHPADKQRG